MAPELKETIVEDDSNPHIDDLHMFSEPKADPWQPITRIDTSRRGKPKAKMNLAQAQALVYKAKIDHTVVEDDSNPHIDDFNMYSLAKAVPAERGGENESVISGTTYTSEPTTLDEEDSLDE